MGISSSLYSSISGLNTMGEAMSVLGDNVANVNTVSFKSSRATFQDVLAQSVSTAAGAAQVGRGVTLSTVDGLFAQGAFASSSNPTDMAIGGQGFFMLRAPDSTEADMYSRAGEFRFDQEGNLVNPVGAYVQGWSIESSSGERQGTIGDINIGKSTPPVATTSIDVIVNLDSRRSNEDNESRLFDAWNGTNAAAVTPTAPISTNNYEYTSAIKIYDSKGASHDITIYFDRTTEDNQWEFLVTCDPSEDQRYLSTDEQVVYAPNERYNYEEHKGAGALMYGVIDFSTAGDISSIAAWSVPPDGKVDPALNTNRMVLDNADSYYSFPSNFTGDTTNQDIEINFGSRYTGLSSNQTQILVSDAGAFNGSSGTDYVTRETTWGNVYDAAGNAMGNGDVLIFEGFQNDGGRATQLAYAVDTTKKVDDLLTDLESTFRCSASIDTQGRLKLTDNTGGDSGMYITSFITISAQGAVPFGGATTVNKNWAETADGLMASDGTTPITDPTTTWTSVYDSSGVQVSDGVTTFSFNGNDVTGAAFAGPVTFTVNTGSSSFDTVQDLLDFIEDIYEDGTVGGTSTGAVTAVLGGDGKIKVIDNTEGGSLSVNISTTAGPSLPLGADGALALQDSLSGKIDITSTKRQVVSSGRSLSTDSGLPPVITASTLWSSVYNESGTAVSDGDTITLIGNKSDGTFVDNTTDPYTIVSTDTVQDFLDYVEEKFDCDAAIDNAGRLVLRDRTADSSSSTSQLAINTITYSGAVEPFGDSFSAIAGDLTEDGSREGDVVSTSFSNEALSSTQYANSSTTIFQDQEGFASGFLQSISVDPDGVITGHYSNGQVLKKAQVALATFNNLSGLNKEGGNVYTETTDSGAPVTGAPGTNGLGSIAPNSLEQSNVDIGTEFVNLITVQRGFQANSKIITTTDDMLNDLINIKR